jgi:hypothetical protein
MSEWFKRMKELAVLAPGAFTVFTATGCGADPGIGVADDDSNVAVAEQHYDLNYQAISYFYCGTEWGEGGKPDTCHLGQGGKYVAFGWEDPNNRANSRYIFKYFPAGDVRCSNDSFPGQTDPAPGKTKSCYFTNMGKVADEGARFTPSSVTGASGTVEIVFGGDLGFFSLSKKVSAFDTITCDSATFGYDGHVTGAPLACYQLSVGYHRVAGAFEKFTVTPNKPVPAAYGSGGYWYYRTLTASGNGQLTCNPADFGAMGGGDSCYVLDLGNNFLAAENKSFSMPRGYDTYPVVYSSGFNGNNIMRNLRTGTCNNTTFTDPQWGMQKNCYGTALIH